MKGLVLAAVAAGALLVGCATGGMKHAEMKAAMPALKAEEGRIYLFRSASLFGAAIQPDIWLNGTVIGTSKPGGFFYIDRPAGDYEVSASTEVERKLTFALAGGETKYIRSSPSFGLLVGRINFELVNPVDAESALAPLSYTGTPAAQ